MTVRIQIPLWPSKQIKAYVPDTSPIRMIKLDVLAVGNLVREDDIIKEAHSTSTLVRTDERNIVVDTSSTFLRPAVKDSLKQLCVLPKDVDTVVLTHSHHDHVENLDLFPKAKVYVRKEEDFGKGVQVDRDTELCPGVRLVHTPGHTAGSMSVFVTSERRYAITGDAVPLEDNVVRMVPPRLNIDKELAMKSIKAIISFADVIVPGHGFPFMNGGVLK